MCHTCARACVYDRHTRLYTHTITRVAPSSITRYGHAIASGILPVSRMQLMIVTNGTLCNPR